MASILARQPTHAAYTCRFAIATPTYERPARLPPMLA